MRALFGMGMHPEADRIIRDHLAAHVTAGMTSAELDAAALRAEAAASLGTPFPEYQPIAPFAHRVTERAAALEAAAGRPATAAELNKIKAQEARRTRAAVAGFDVVFAPVKSAALVWALDERPAVRAAVRAAHEAARDATLAMLEEHAALTRTGKGGIAQLATNGLTMAVFDHYDSRAGEPNLHTHVVISSKVQGTDGVWRALDARPLYRMTVAASEHYNTRFEVELSTRLTAAGYTVSFAPRPDTARNAEPVREITGVPAEFIAFFSTRRAATEARYQQLIREYRAGHGHDPSPQACHKLARQANLETRDAKGPARSLGQMRADWRAAITARFGPSATVRVMAAVPAATPGGHRSPPAPLDVDTAARQAVAANERARSTWTAWNIRAEAERIIRNAHAAATPAEHEQLAAAITSRALSPGHSVAVTAPDLVSEPGSLRRPGPDGQRESVFTDHGATRYTSHAMLAAEQRLVAAATATAPVTPLTHARARAALAEFETATGTRLDPGQRGLVTAFATSPRLLTAGLGPAGTGKTTAMRAYAHLTAAAGIRIIALAPSAAAADVLSQDMGVHADTVHKFLHEHTRGPHAARLAAGQPVTGPAAIFALRAGRRGAHRRSRDDRHPAAGPGHRHRRQPGRGHPAARRPPAALGPRIRRRAAPHHSRGWRRGTDHPVPVRQPSRSPGNPADPRRRPGRPGVLHQQQPHPRRVAAGHDRCRLRRLETGHGCRAPHHHDRGHHRKRHRPGRPRPAGPRQRRAGRARWHHPARWQPGRNRRLDRHPPQPAAPAHLRRPGLGQERRRLARHRPPPRRLPHHHPPRPRNRDSDPARRLRRRPRRTAIRHHHPPRPGLHR